MVGQPLNNWEAQPNCVVNYFQGKGGCGEIRINVILTCSIFSNQCKFTFLSLIDHMINQS